MFKRGEEMHALVEFATTAMATKCLHKMNGKYMFQENNLLHLKYANVDTLNISQSSKMAKDYTIEEAKGKFLK